MFDFKKIIIKFLPAVLFIGISVAGFFYILTSIKTINANTVSINEQVLSETARRSNILALNAEIKNISEERKMLETHFAQDSDVVPFLDNLQALSVKAGAPAEVASVDLNKEDGHLEVSMKTKGSFVAVYKLLSLLENSPFEIDFSSVHIDREFLSEAEIKANKVAAWNATFALTLLSFNTKQNAN